MRRVSLLVLATLLGLAPVFAQDAAPESTAPAASTTVDPTTAAALAIAAGKAKPPEASDFLEHLVDSVLHAFNVQSSGNTTTHFVIAALFVVVFYLLRRVVTTVVFNILRRFAARTETTLDDKLFPALEAPVSTFFVLLGFFSALKVLKLSESGDRLFDYSATVAFSLNVFWLLLRAFNTILDHLHEVATERKAGVAAFMPWIKKSLVTIFVVFGLLMMIQSLGFDVKAALGALGIGGLAFALAAQDTIANLFGSVVVAVDQPFKIGETVQIGATIGTVEDIGLRSTRIRRLDRALVAIPNKTVAGEAITNLSRFTQRRFEQVLGLTYDSKPEQLEAVVREIRDLILAEPEVDKNSVLVFFRDFSASSLDLWIVYATHSPDNTAALTLKQRLNFAFMRTVERHGLSFAFPTQTVHLDGSIARALAEKKA